MPYQWVEPDRFITSPPGFSDVYHCYDEGNVMIWHYQIREDRFDSGWTAFDIRELAMIVDAGRKEGYTEQEHASLVTMAQAMKPLSKWLEEIGYEGETE